MDAIESLHGYKQYMQHPIAKAIYGWVEVVGRRVEWICWGMDEHSDWQSLMLDDLRELTLGNVDWFDSAGLPICEES